MKVNADQVEVAQGNGATRETDLESHIGAPKETRVADFQLAEAPVVAVVAVEMSKSVIRYHTLRW